MANCTAPDRHSHSEKLDYHDYQYTGMAWAWLGAAPKKAADTGIATYWDIYVCSRCLHHRRIEVFRESLSCNDSIRYPKARDLPVPAR